MANYISFLRTNYFHTKDQKETMEILNRIVMEDDDIEIWHRPDGTVAFGGSEIEGLRPTDDTDENLNPDDVYAALQSVVAPDDAIIIHEIGYENLRYLVGAVVVITEKLVDFDNIADRGQEMAREALGNDSYFSPAEY